MDEFLKGIGAAVAVIASLGAVALVVDQFTLRARLRRTEDWAVAMLAEDLSAERAKILRSIRLDATSRIVAGILMPVRFFMEGVVWTIACAMIVVGVLRAESFWTSAGLTSVLFAFVTLSLSTRRTVRVYLERCRIASEYRRNLPVKEGRRGILDLMEGGERVEFAFATGFAASVCTLASGIGLAWSGDDIDGGPLALIVLGGFTTYAVLDLLRIYALRQHPMRPPVQTAAQDVPSS